MRTIYAFVIGAIAGGIVVLFWGREIGEYVGEATSEVRAKAATGLRAVEQEAGAVLNRGVDGLRRAQEFVEETRGEVSEVLRAGQDLVRPAARTGGA
jgi:hypothetical protein